jgi:hypothetical protein
VTNQQTFILTSGIIFAVVALMHVVRLTLRWEVKINQQEIPIGLSAGGLVVAAGLCIWAFWLLF